jgi:hypothetical protein
MCLPKGQDSELSGLFVYCTQILVWLPPLIFSGLVQAGVSQSIGVMAVACFGVAAVIVISMFPSWPEVLADVAKHDSVVEPEFQNEGLIAEKADGMDAVKPDDHTSSLMKTTPESKV